ncbi:hypothetical protein [Bradyrhizobium sp. C9]|uniref:hypothetical protein n=1 Tax=Bradyrhizobium sp. C9 TaxID=142585 RepID=UPI001177A0E0|nr:hypothetical protein [Bradyrhizobium sp. C9]
MAHADAFLSMVWRLRKAAGKMIARTGEIPEGQKIRRNIAMIDDEISTFSKVLQLNSADRWLERARPRDVGRRRRNDSRRSCRAHRTVFN